MEDSLSIVISSTQAQSRLHAPTGNSPAPLEFLREAGFALAHEATRQYGGDLWFGQPQSNAVSANSELPRAKGSSASRFQGKNPTSSSVADCPPETAGRITSRRTGEDSRAGTCVPQPAGDINRAIHSDSGSRQE